MDMEFSEHKQRIERKLEVEECKVKRMQYGDGGAVASIRGGSLAGAGDTVFRSAC
ncbi:unnamed protein product [Brassica rapa subsp. trilocularis]